jgi:hypothetical protein
MRRTIKHGTSAPASMATRRIFARPHLIALAVVVLSVAALLAYRAWYVEPRVWGGLCAAADRPLACLPRAGLLWLQHYYLWGLAALALGLWAFLGGPFAAAVAAVALGIGAVINYNATWGMIGAALGLWAWFRRALPPPGAAEEA